jgi:hypothetical protein
VHGYDASTKCFRTSFMSVHNMSKTGYILQA